MTAYWAYTTSIALLIVAPVVLSTAGAALLALVDEKEGARVAEEEALFVT